MADSISVAGLALSVFGVLDVVLKTVRAMSDKVSSSGGILQNQRLWIRVQQTDLDCWLGYWGINTKDGDISSIDDRLEIYWGRDGRIAIYEILQIETILRRPKTLETSYPTTSPDPSASTKWCKWVHATKVGFRFAFRDRNEFKELWEDLKRCMFCLNATSRRWLKQRHPDCQKPQDTEVKIGPNSVTYIGADKIQQESRMSSNTSRFLCACSSIS
ncbi:hypothetical protein BDD12DRAFT_804379 [Trichophaea hybrida]|nr:hypothetical protein BDD12DRAFT_804379 [Trichophaea hybrida]